MKMSAPRSRRSPSKSRQSPPKSRQVLPKRRAPLSLQRASSPARKQPRAISVPSPTADRRGGPLLYLGHAWPCKDIFRVEFSNESAAATLLFMLTSHDLVPRDENTNGYANEMKRLERHFQRKEMSGWLYSAYYYSSFTYSLIGFAMVLYFNRRLPDKFWQAAALNVDAFALILVAQGPLSFWADVFASDWVFCYPRACATLYRRLHFQCRPTACTTSRAPQEHVARRRQTRHGLQVARPTPHAVACGQEVKHCLRFG